MNKKLYILLNYYLISNSTLNTYKSNLNVNNEENILHIKVDENPDHNNNDFSYQEEDSGEDANPDIDYENISDNNSHLSSNDNSQNSEEILVEKLQQNFKNINNLIPEHRSSQKAILYNYDLLWKIYTKYKKIRKYEGVNPKLVFIITAQSFFNNIFLSKESIFIKAVLPKKINAENNNIKELFTTDLIEDFTNFSYYIWHFVEKSFSDLNPFIENKIIEINEDNINIFDEKEEIEDHKYYTKILDKLCAFTINQQYTLLQKIFMLDKSLVFYCMYQIEVQLDKKEYEDLESIITDINDTIFLIYMYLMHIFEDLLNNTTIIQEVKYISNFLKALHAIITYYRLQYNSLDEYNMIHNSMILCWAIGFLKVDMKIIEQEDEDFLPSLILPKILEDIHIMQKNINISVIVHSTATLFKKPIITMLDKSIITILDKSIITKITINNILLIIIHALDKDKIKYLKCENIYQIYNMIDLNKTIEKTHKTPLTLKLLEALEQKIQFYSEPLLNIHNNSPVADKKEQTHICEKKENYLAKESHL